MQCRLEGLHRNRNMKAPETFGLTRVLSTVNDQRISSLKVVSHDVLDAFSIMVGSQKPVFCWSQYSSAEAPIKAECNRKQSIHVGMKQC